MDRSSTTIPYDLGPIYSTIAVQSPWSRPRLHDVSVHIKDRMKGNDAQRFCLDLVMKARRISQSVETYHILLPIEKPQVAVISTNICGRFSLA